MRNLLSWIVVPTLVALALLAGPHLAASPRSFTVGPFRDPGEAGRQARIWQSRGYYASVRGCYVVCYRGY